MYDKVYTVTTLYSSISSGQTITGRALGKLYKLPQNNIRTVNGHVPVGNP